MDDALAILQREVQRNLGRCMIRLQQYERLMKAMVANMAVEGPPEQLQANRDKQVACANTKTLGILIGKFTGSYLSPAVSDGTTEPVDDAADQEVPSQGWFRMRHQLVIPLERYEQTTQALTKLVAMRNELVHHLLERFDLGLDAGCRAAEAYLDICFEQVDGHFLTLMGWIKSMENARALAASIMQSPQFEDAIVHGIWPDGSVHWASSTIAECLRNAEQACAVDGWTLLNSAIEHIRHSDPDQTPKRYGCGSWRHVIHASQQFEIRKKTNKDTDGVAVWYRSRPEEAAMNQEQPA
jgi:hypothetical protein